MLTLIASLLGAVVGPLLQSLKSQGVNLGPIGDEALNIIDATQIDIANFESGQVVVLGTFTHNGDPGTIVAVKNGGPAAASLGL